MFAEDQIGTLSIAVDEECVAGTPPSYEDGVVRVKRKAPGRGWR